MANVLTPDPRLRLFSDLGVVAPGALLHTYVSGTPATPLATTSDAAGAVNNPNPIVASAGGLFGPIYLSPGVAYHFVLTDAAGLPIWDQDPVMAGIGGAAGALSVAGGGTGVASLAPGYSLLTAGATPTGPVLTVAPGPAGTILRSGGAGFPPIWMTNVWASIISLADGPTVTMDANFGTLQTLVANGDRTMAAPANPTVGQRLIIAHYANGANRTLTLAPGANGFRFGATIPALTVTANGTTDYIGCLYSWLGFWDVVAYSKGF